MHSPVTVPVRAAIPTLAPGLRVAFWLSGVVPPLVILATAASLLAPAVYQRNPATIIPALRGQVS